MKIRTLIVDDSAVIRTLYSRMLSSDPEIEIVGVACDPFEARELLVRLRPDVMTLDIEMPRMDGLTFLEKVMEYLPVRTLIISSFSGAGASQLLRAFELGAVDVISKPTLQGQSTFEQVSQELISRVKAVAHANLPNPTVHYLKSKNSLNKYEAIHLKQNHKIIAIGASTGGTEALKVVLSALPENIPGTVIVQHMPPVFTKTYAATLQRLCPFEVKEAEDGDCVQEGRVILAPGNFHMTLVKSGNKFHVALDQNPPLHGVRPSVDILFQSVAKVAGPQSIGMLLTGMGSDGARGLLEMKKAGSFNIAQDELTSVVFGMPKEAIALKAVHAILPLDKIADAVLIRILKRIAS